MELALKKMRLHHRVLAQVSFNAYKVMTQQAELITLSHGQVLYRQSAPAEDLYFILYGAL
jgi:CRP-like cAMP-binding protein